MPRTKALRLLPTEEEIDGILAFDDLTLSSLVNANARMGAMAKAIDDGHNNDEPYRSLPLERWRDRA